MSSLNAENIDETWMTMFNWENLYEIDKKLGTDLELKKPIANGLQ